MSDEKQNQQGKVWVLSIAGTVITAVIVPIIVAAIPNLDKLPFLKSAPPTFGKIEVDAKMPGGTNFTNDYGSSKKYRFVASGKWTYNTEIQGIGMHDPAGHPGYPSASDLYYLPGKAEGSLIVRRENGSYQFVGNETILELQPKESIFFTINDTNSSNGGNYSDNDGSVTVEWHLQKQK